MEDQRVNTNFAVIYQHRLFGLYVYLPILNEYINLQIFAYISLRKYIFKIIYYLFRLNNVGYSLKLCFRIMKWNTNIRH